MHEPNERDAELRALRDLVVHARFMAGEAGATEVRDFLDQVEFLWDVIEPAADPPMAFREALRDVTESGGCGHVLERYDEATENASVAAPDDAR